MAEQAAAKVTVRDYLTPYQSDWCPGCGNFGILRSLQQALAGLNLPPHKVAIFGGIGCSGKTPYYVGTYSVTTLHGRVLPYATGAKLANPEMTVVAVGGDGDGLGIGAGHFVGAGRRNVDLTYIFFTNEVYGLTKGQAAPTLDLGLQTKSLPAPTIQSSVNPLMMAMAAGYTWIGRSYAYNIKDTTELMQKAIQHRGLAFLEVLQPCPTYNDLHTRDWYSGADLEGEQQRVYTLGEDYDPVIPEEAQEADVLAKMAQFMAKANEWGDRIPTGVFWENRSVSSFTDRILTRIPSYLEVPPAKRPVADDQGRTALDLSSHVAALAV